eukprot:703921-Pelagomonas_calceolata.AAC.5
MQHWTSLWMQHHGCSTGHPYGCSTMDAALDIHTDAAPWMQYWTSIQMQHHGCIIMDAVPWIEYHGCSTTDAAPGIEQHMMHHLEPSSNRRENCLSYPSPPPPSLSPLPRGVSALWHHPECTFGVAPHFPPLPSAPL